MKLILLLEKLSVQQKLDIKFWVLSCYYCGKCFRYTAGGESIGKMRSS